MNYLYLLFIFVFVSSLKAQSPPNDDFANRISLNDGTVQTTGTNVSATFEANESRNPSVAGDQTVWWEWTSQTSDSVTIDTIGSNYDTTLAVYEGVGNNLTDLALIGSNDDFSGLQSGVVFTPVAGQTYYFQVAGFSGRTGNIVLNYPMSAPGPPVITQDLVNRSVVTGTDVTLSVSAFGERPLSYQWFFNGAPIANENDSTLVINNFIDSDVGNYHVIVSNPLGSTQSSTVLVRLVRVLSAFSDDFDPDYDPDVWLEFNGRVEANTNGQAAGSGSTNNSLWFGGDGERSALTRAIDTTNINDISFKIALGNGVNPWDAPEEGEEIVLEYTTEGVFYTVLGVYNNTSWEEFVVELPFFAKAPTTQFRFRQLSNSGSGSDHWAIEDLDLRVTGTGLYDEWAESEIPNPALRGVNVNADHDSLPNLVDYALGLSPLENDQSPFDLLVQESMLQFSYDRPINGRDELIYRIVYSDDLVTWQTASESDLSFELSDTRERVTFSLPIENSDDKYFIRLEVDFR